MRRNRSTEGAGGSTVRLLLVDDHRLFREGVAAGLSQCQDIEAVLEAADADRAVRVYREQRPDLVLMDVEMPERDGLEAFRDIRAIDSDCKVMFLSGYEYDSYVQGALDLSACGYVLKREGLAVLKRAISEVARGGCYFSESILARLTVENGRLKLARPKSVAIAALSRRERELLRHLGMGASLKEAAVTMHVSYKTADNQKASLMRKLDIHDRVALARFAIREGWVSA